MPAGLPIEPKAVAIVETALRRLPLSLRRLRLPFDRLEDLELLAEPFPQVRTASEALGSRGASIVRQSFVRFKSRGERFQVNVDTTDPGFLYVSAAYAFEKKPDFDGRFWQTLIEVQRAVKAAKFLTEGDLLVAGVEQFWSESGGFEAIFWRCVNIVHQCAAECMRRFSAPEYAGAGTAVAATSNPEDAQQAALRFLAEFAPPPPSDASTAEFERPRRPCPRRKKPRP